MIVHRRLSALAFRAACVVALAIAPAVILADEQPSADELLARSIAYHDPQGRLLGAAHRLTLRSERPDGPSRTTDLLIDLPAGRFELVEARDPAEGVLRGVLEGDECRELVDVAGATRPLTCERLQRMRNYYVYLWGLPMKLRDPGTHLGNVQRTTYQGRDVWGVRVTYDPAVGTDVWIVYFDIDDASLAGYRFYHDEAAGDGEYIVLDGEQITPDGTVRLPARRTWYTHQGDELLGTDVLEAISSAASPGLADD